MGSDVSEVVEALPSPHDIKVHRLMCTGLIKLVNSVLKILPKIEAAQPRSSGISALCLLNKAIDKAKLMLQQCCESSKLYLALTGDAILSKCQKSRDLLEQSLIELQNMVPIMLAAEISKMISDLRGVAFSLDPSEKKAGKVLRELLHCPADSMEEIAFKAIQVASLRLHITSQKDLLIEKRSIKKLLDTVGENEQSKRKILLFLHSLLKKHGKLIVKEQKENESMLPGDLFNLSNSYSQSVDMEPCLIGGPDEAQINKWSLPVIPEEFKCPLSSRLLYDPVVIASGLTFERKWIQRWFDEGHDECPKTKKKLAHLSLTPNTVMKDLITQWCRRTGVTVPDPSMPVVFHQLETSSTSIASLSSSVYDLSLPVDFSNSSFESSDAGHCSFSSHGQIANDVNMMSMKIGDCSRLQFGECTDATDIEILFELDSFPWQYRCKLVNDFEKLRKHEGQTYSLMSCEKLIQTLVKFLKDADDLHDIEAQRSGCLLLSAFVRKCRSNTIPHLEDGTYELLASFLDTEVAEETLGLLEVLSCHRSCDYEIAASGVLHHILSILNKDISELHETALKILCNLSANSKIRSLIVPSDFIPKLFPFFEDSVLVRYSMTILKNLCYNEDARVFLAEADGCIASLTKLLESDSQDDQEHAVDLLLSLCLQQTQYCQLVLEEGVIPGLVAISTSGNYNAKTMAKELLRILRDGVTDSEEVCKSEVEVLRDLRTNSRERKSPSKVQGIFRKISVFSKK